MRYTKLFIVTFFIVAIAGALLSLRSTAASNARRREGQKPAAATADHRKYIGSETCAECHSAETTFYQLTAHNKLNSDMPKDRQSCEACHGGARDHVAYYKEVDQLLKSGKETEATALMNNEARLIAAKMTSIDELSPTESSQICLKCHEGTQGRSDERFNYRRSEHFRNGVSCADCHSSHSPKRLEFLLKEKEPEGCYKCHADQKSSFQKPFHHKVPEGGMKCSDCHNHHGGFMPRNLRNTVTGDMQCVKCHADKQGPFVYEHAPIKVEGCQACHTPFPGHRTPQRPRRLAPETSPARTCRSPAGR
ncbi:MAG: cytochrome c3 family protein [bacterium]